MADCIFCKIATGEIPARIVRRTPDAVAFYDLQPQAPTHVLVIPTKHLGAVRDVLGRAGEAGKLLVYPTVQAAVDARSSDVGEDR